MVDICMKIARRDASIATVFLLLLQLVSHVLNQLKLL